MLNDSLLAALIQGKGANDRYMARDELTVRPQGIRYRDSGVQTPFGKWLAGRVIAALKQSAGRGETIIIGDAVVPESKFHKRGLKLSERTAESEMITEASGDYVLSGEYWDLGDIVDLRLKMSSGVGNDVSWQGNIRRESISTDLALKPTKDYRDERKNDNLGPITLGISSNRGRNPIYRVGQKMVLFVEASQDSYLYCFYRQADGSVMRIFPNRHHGSARIAGGASQKIPSQRMKFDWTIAEPVGTEIAKCHAFDRDVEQRLPRMIRKLDFEPLPYRSLAEVTAALRQIRGVGIAENSIVVNVER